MLMAEAPVPDRPNIHSNAIPWLKGPGVHADVLIRTVRGEARRFMPAGRQQRRGPEGSPKT